MLQVSAELFNGAPKCVDHDITTLPNHNLIKLWINSTSAFITHWNLAKKVYGVTPCRTSPTGIRVLSGLNAPDDSMHFIKRVGGDEDIIFAIMEETADTVYGEKVQVDYAFMDGSLPPLPESFSNFRAPLPAQMSQIDQAANKRAYDMYNMKPKQIKDMLEDLEEYFTTLALTGP